MGQLLSRLRDVAECIPVRGFCFLLCRRQGLFYQKVLGDLLISLLFSVSNKAIGSVTLAIYRNVGKTGEDLSVVGLFYVLPLHRGKSVGHDLFNAATRDSTDRKFLFGSIRE